MIKNIFVLLTVFLSTLMLKADNTKRFDNVSVNVVSRVRVIENAERYSVEIKNQDENNPIVWEIDEKFNLKIKYLNPNDEEKHLNDVQIKITTPRKLNLNVGSEFLMQEIAKRGTDEKNKD